jgi:hypothetical protein
VFLQPAQTFSSVALSAVEWEPRICFCGCCLLHIIKRTIISTNAVHGLIVGGAVENTPHTTPVLGGKPTFFYDYPWKSRYHEAENLSIVMILSTVKLVKTLVSPSS